MANNDLTHREYVLVEGVVVPSGPEKPSTEARYTGCHRRNGPNFGRVFLMLNYNDITQNTYIQS